MEKFLTINEKTVSYQVFGKGKPVMLVHGFGESNIVWRNQVQALQDKYFIIVPNLPGTGSSEIIDDMSLPGLAEVLKEIMDKEVSPGDMPMAERVSLIGHSMGGYISLAFAQKYPEYLRSLGLFSSSSFADNDEKKQTRRKGISFIKEHGAKEFIKSTTPNLFSPDTKEKNPGLIEEQIREADNFSAEALVWYYEAMIARPDRSDLLKITTLPILFVLGVHDKAIPLEDGLKLCHLPEKSYIDLLQQSGHMGMLEEAEKSHKALDKFLSES